MAVFLLSCFILSHNQLGGCCRALSVCDFHDSESTIPGGVQFVAGCNAYQSAVHAVKLNCLDAVAADRHTPLI